ncbi:peptidyl-prolyl cis-trans isomerase [candidate division WOR-3 bacterium]|nr:peptidyl-prolyl cis-trans isomerase [candidate division WOR-3 bacterium]
MLFLVLISAFSLISKEKPVAIVGNEKVFEEDIPDGLTLDRHLQNLVFLELAEEKGYDDSVRADIDQVFNKEVVRRTVRGFSGEASMPTQYDCVLFYKNSRKKLFVQIIQTNSFFKAAKAYLEVLKGEDFGSVSEKYSVYPELRKSKGHLQYPISWSAAFPRSFNMVFNMRKGGISVPLKYAENWNIVKIIDIKEENGKNAFDISKMEKEIKDPRLRLRIAREKSSLYTYKFRKFIPWIANPKIDSKGLSMLIQRISAPEEKSMHRGLPFGEGDLDVVLAHSAIGEYKIRDFIEDAALAGDLSQFGNENAASLFIRDNIFNRTLTAMCRRLGVHRNSSLSESYERRFSDATLDFFKSKEILPIIKETEDDLRNFYEENKDKYVVPEKRKVSLIEVKEEQEAQEARERLLKGEDFEALAREISIARGREHGGSIGYIREDQKGAIGREAFLLQKGEISNVFETKIAWAVIKVTDIKNSYQQVYSDVKSSVRIDYREAKAKEIGNKIFEQNKERFGLKVLD